MIGAQCVAGMTRLGGLGPRPPGPQGQRPGGPLEQGPTGPSQAKALQVALAEEPKDYQTCLLARPHVLLHCV